jgi:hypothetical protein
MALRGDLSTLRGLRTKIRALPLSVAHSVAQRAAPALTGKTREAYDGGRTVYGEARPRGVNGEALDLHRTGAARADLRFVATGTIIRCVFTKRYVRYLIGNYSVLPNGPLPVGWTRSLGELVRETKADL